MISKTRLLKPKRPQRWKGRWASKPRVCGQHVLRVGPIKDVVVERAVLRAKRVRVRRFLAKIETRPPRIVEQNAGGHPSTRRQKKWDALIDRIGGLLEAVAVRIPHAIGVT